jgi:hypothetical protein
MYSLFVLVAQIFEFLLEFFYFVVLVFEGVLELGFNFIEAGEFIDFLLVLLLALLQSLL